MARLVPGPARGEKLQQNPRADGDPVAFGGVWEEWRSPDGETLRTFATMTTEATPELALIQDRMPVIIERDDWPL